jgi:hypothetical protein
MKDPTAIALHSQHPLGRHPLADKAMTGAEMIVQVLADEGVEAIFGYSGGAILPTYDAVFTFNEAQKTSGGRQVPLIVPANEQGAGFMAAGYARASGRVGVCLVTSGPGATNTVTPVRDCMADSVPIVVICGQVARAAIGTDAFQHRVRDRAYRPAGPGGGRRTEGCTDHGRRVPGRRAAGHPRLPRAAARAHRQHAG